MSDDVIHVPHGARVRLPAIERGTDRDGNPHEVVRALTSAGAPVDTPPGKALIVLRHAKDWRGVLAATAFAADRSMSWVLMRLLDSPLVAQLDRADLPSTLLEGRGRPSTDTERTINRVVELDLGGGGFAAELVGPFCDQAYWVKPSHLEQLEQLARSLNVTPDQAADALLGKFLVNALAELG